MVAALGLLDTEEAHSLLFGALRDGRTGVGVSAVGPVSAIARRRSHPLSGRARSELVALAAVESGIPETTAAQAASALFWDGIDGQAFWRLLETGRPAQRLRAARVLTRHPLTPDRAARLEKIIPAEQDAEIRTLLEAVIDMSRRQVRPSGIRGPLAQRR